MKRFDLNAMGVQEMSHSEMVKTDAGCGVFLPLIVSSGVIKAVLDTTKTIMETNNGNKENDKKIDNKDNGSNNGTNNQKK